MSLKDRIGGLKGLLRLREQRVEAARRAVAAAQAVVTQAEAALRARDEAIALHDRHIGEMDEWFAGGAGGDARLIESALSRRGLIVDRRTADVDARADDSRAVIDAIAAQGEAVKALMRATARRDAVALQLAKARATQMNAREELEHTEFEDRGRPAPKPALKLVQGGRR